MFRHADLHLDLFTYWFKSTLTNKDGLDDPIAKLTSIELGHLHKNAANWNELVMIRLTSPFLVHLLTSYFTICFHMSPFPLWQKKGERHLFSSSKYWKHSVKILATKVTAHRFFRWARWCVETHSNSDGSLAGQSGQILYVLHGVKKPWPARVNI